MSGLPDGPHVYLFTYDDLLSKVGRSSNLTQRLASLRHGKRNPRMQAGFFAHVWPCWASAQFSERQAHHALAEFAIGREWFRIRPAHAALIIDAVASGQCDWPYTDAYALTFATWVAHCAYDIKGLPA